VDNWDYFLYFHLRHQSNFQHAMCDVFSFRSDILLSCFIDPSVQITSLVTQVLTLPIGRFFQWLLPTTRFTTFGYTWSFNPGPFNIKEHTVISVMANIVVYGAYATDLLLSQELFYGKKFGYLYEILICLGSQLMGYSLGGLLRKFVVWPANMIWPGVLVNAAFLNTVHKNYSIHEKKKHMTREKFFLVVSLCSFVWYWVPGFLWTGLSFFSWVCWIAPANVTVNTLFGYSSGLGMGVLTFDWAMISFIGSPLVTPVSDLDCQFYIF
jgi:OPT family oligopeptide transporter